MMIYHIKLVSNELTYDLSFKIILIGDSVEGKTCLSNRATKDYFENMTIQQLDLGFLHFVVKLKKK